MHRFFGITDTFMSNTPLRESDKVTVLFPQKMHIVA